MRGNEGLQNLIGLPPLVELVRAATTLSRRKKPRCANKGKKENQNVFRDQPQKQLAQLRLIARSLVWAETVRDSGQPQKNGRMEAPILLTKDDAVGAMADFR
jgi:hypothetical protein